MNSANPPPHSLKKTDIRRRFDRVAADFDGADVVHRHCFAGISERLGPMQIEAQRVLDLGCATGSGTRLLAKAYRGARVLGVDLSLPMLKQARRRRGFFSRPKEIQASADALPFATASIDVVVANLLLPWIDEPAAVFAEIRRVLRKDGVFAFSTLGPDSFLELRQRWQQEDDFSHVNAFADMHNLGDALVRAGLADPVLDVDRLTVTYSGHERLLNDLKRAGARNTLLARRPTMTGKQRFQRVFDALQSPEPGAPISVNLEVIFGHAWGSGPAQPPGEFRIEAGAIGRIRR